MKKHSILQKQMEEQGCALNGLVVEVLSGTQATGKGNKTTLTRVDNRDWNSVGDHIMYLHDQDKKKQIRVILLWSYYLKDLDRFDALPGTIPTVKRTGESVVAVGDSPARKKGRPGPASFATIS
jgi:hypothetical protein